jgi:hypothetical protein
MLSPGSVYRTDQIRASLLDGNGVFSGNVLLDIGVALLPGERGFDDGAITDVSVTFGVRMPADGEYTVPVSLDESTAPSQTTDRTSKSQSCSSTNPKRMGQCHQPMFNARNRS